MACEGKVRIRVLHVDDDPMILEITKIFLRRESNGSGVEFEIASALSAEEALMLLRRERFDVIISDYSMPRMDGLVFLDEVKRIVGEIPFIIFSGFSEEVEEKAMKKGAIACIPKSGDPILQFRRLAHILRKCVSGEGKKNPQFSLN